MDIFGRRKKLGSQYAENWHLPSTSTIAIVIITQPVSWYSFYDPTNSGRLSRPRHCSKGAQPVPKAAYRSGCRDIHNCARRDSNSGPLIPQSDALITRPLRQCTLYCRSPGSLHARHGCATVPGASSQFRVLDER